MAKLTEAQLRRDGEALYQEYLGYGYTPAAAARAAAREVHEAALIDIDALEVELAADAEAQRALPPRSRPDDLPY